MSPPAATGAPVAVSPVHVERTDHPATLRWVCHEPGLVRVAAMRATCGDGPLARLLEGSVLTEVQAHGGDLLVGVADADRWPAVASIVHDAVLAALDHAGHDAPHDDVPEALVAATPDPPTIDEVRAAVDRLAGPVAADHGGRIEVVDVDASSVRVRLDGACRGCARSSDTLSRLVATAVERVHPGAELVVEDGCGSAEPRTRLAWPRRRR
ncbi:MAG: NifU family protein [Acidimicrobiales bacterium]